METDYIVELLLDEAPLHPEERAFVRALRGKWVEPGERRRLQKIHEQRMPRGKHGPTEAL